MKRSLFITLERPRSERPRLYRFAIFRRTCARVVQEFARGLGWLGKRSQRMPLGAAPLVEAKGTAENSLNRLASVGG